MLLSDIFGMSTEQLMVFVFAGLALLVLFAGFVTAFSKFYRKPGPEEAIVRTGVGGLATITGRGMIVVPLIQEAHLMDLSVKRVLIARDGEDGLICQDNMRADIKVTFFIRVNNQPEDIKTVAETIGPRRASEQDKLEELFEAKFSEALKTVGKNFEFVKLYTERDQFKEQILRVIGTDLNGYVLDDCAIDYLEQTPLERLNPNNILDAEGIKKITQLTALEKVQENQFTREKEKTLKKQDVEAQEAILELEKQRVEAVEKQKREIATITSREQAEAAKIQEEEHLKAETARIRAAEEIAVQEENKQRQVLVAQRSKERTDGVEQERVTRDRELEITERERVVGLAAIEKEKAIEIEKKNIQEVIRERVAVERAVVEEQERIKNTEAFMGADRAKTVAITHAEKDAQELLVKQVKAAEAAKAAAELTAEQVVVEAEARRASAEKDTSATKMLAEAKAADHAAIGLADAEVMVAKADAIERTGTAEANVLQKKAVAEAKGQEARAIGIEKEGAAEAAVMQLKFTSEANGIQEKAEAMKLFDGVGREHEEFKLRLNKDKEIEIAAISTQKDIAEAQAGIVGEALKTARIDIVGGESTFFDQIVGSIKAGKAVDRFVHNSETVTDIKQTFFNGDPEYFKNKLAGFVSQFNMSFDDVKDLSVVALIAKLLTTADTDETRSELTRMLDTVAGTSIATRKIASLAGGSSEGTGA
ncbi:MAG: flotillin family protein [Planctomycetota bacterium]|nr:flotillin family protein [Planctomycetota bacterium]MDA0918042.1 flotillin family protein [Planctomycetota bacterium]